MDSGLLSGGWISGPLSCCAVVIVRTPPSALIVNRNVRCGHCSQMPLAAICLPSDVACAHDHNELQLPYLWRGIEA
jgi:hypothetical protein